MWRALPQTTITDFGLLQYNFDHTLLDVNLFMDFNYDAANLTLADTENQYFRVAVIPASFLTTGKLDVNNYEAVMQTLGATEDNIIKVSN